jgi:hypothetical protein
MKKIIICASLLLATDHCYSASRFTAKQDDFFSHSNLSLAKTAFVYNLIQEIIQDEQTLIKANQKEGGLDQATKEVLLHFGNVIGSFFNLLQDTQNVDHVGNCVQGMLCEMVNLGVAAIRNNKLESNNNAAGKNVVTIIKKLTQLIQERLTLLLEQKNS